MIPHPDSTYDHNKPKTLNLKPLDMKNFDAYLVVKS